MNKEYISKLFYEDEDYINAALYTAKEQDRWSNVIFAKSLLFQGKLDDAYFEFRQLKMDYEAGYCQLMKGFLFLAEKIWSSSNQDSFDISWGLSLLSFLNGDRIKSPLYFQIRSFLEQDINMFYKIGISDYANKLMEHADIFARINPESYKFFGRVLFHNQKYEVAREFLKLSLDVCFKDPETHFLIAGLHVLDNNISQAQKSLKTAIDVSGGYYPAEIMLRDLR